MLADNPAADADDLVKDTTTALPPGRADRIDAAAGARRFLGALVRALQAAHARPREGGAGRRRQGEARQDEHRRASRRSPASSASSRSRPSSPSSAASRSTASWAPCRRARSRASSSASSGPLGPSAAEEILAEADALAAEGDAGGAAELYAAVLAQDPENVAALAALAKLHVELGDLEGAQALPRHGAGGKANDPAIAGARAAIELAEQAGSLGDLADLQRRVEADPARPSGALRSRPRPQRPRTARGSGRPPP